jgi:voltage-gated sodium channel
MWLESGAFERLLTCLLLLNAASMVAQTYDNLLTSLSVQTGMPVRAWLLVFDWLVIAFFSLEIGAKFIVYGHSFLRDRWNLLDVVATFGSLLGQSPAFAVLRVLRLLRIFRQVRSVRLITRMLGKSISGCLSIGLLMIVVLFVFALMGHALYGTSHPELFGELHSAMYTLFRVSTFFALDAVAAELIKAHPYVYFFLFPYFLLMSFVLVSFFASIIIFYLEDFDFDRLTQELKQPRGTVPVPGQDAPLPQRLLSDDQYRSVWLQINSLREEMEQLRVRRLS